MTNPSNTTFEILPRLPRALVVDDEPSVRTACVMTLALEGWEVSGAPSAAIALERLARDSYDVLVIDYAMPDVNGLGLVAAMDPETRPPVVLTSAYADGAVAYEALQQGVWDLQAKPLLPAELRRRVRRAYSRNEDAAAPDGWMARVLRYCTHRAWPEALAELDAWPAADRVAPADLVLGLVAQIFGDESRARAAFQRANWWPEWRHQGAEIWTELARRLG